MIEGDADNTKKSEAAFDPQLDVARRAAALSREFSQREEGSSDTNREILACLRRIEESCRSILGAAQQNADATRRLE